MLQPRLKFVLCLLVYTVIVRLLPYVLMSCDVTTDASVLYYPWNFSPLTALCLFGGACLADRRLAFALPLATLFLSDLGIWALSGRFDWAFSLSGTLFLYASFSLAAALGSVLRSRTQQNMVGRAWLMGMGFETAFFVASNYLVWCFGATDSVPMYAPTTAGLLACYVAGLPFFGKSLLGTTAFTMLLFSPLGIRAATEVDEPMGDLAHAQVK
jgi:hypothetical protein